MLNNRICNRVQSRVCVADRVYDRITEVMKHVE